MKNKHTDICSEQIVRNEILFKVFWKLQMEIKVREQNFLPTFFFWKTTSEVTLGFWNFRISPKFSKVWAANY